jgi:hypothetical protein
MAAPERGEAEFTVRLEEELAKSRFSLCVEARTEPAVKRLLRIRSGYDALESGRLCLHDPLVFSLDNCIAPKAPAGFDRVLRIGAGENSALWDEALREEYSAFAAAFYLEREALLTAYRKLYAASRNANAEWPERQMGLSCERRRLRCACLQSCG